MVRVRLIGNAEIDTGSSVLTPSQEVVFACALYLALERGRRVSRTKLASLLWPSVSESMRSHRLRQTILQLKKLGLPLMLDKDGLMLEATAVESDLENGVQTAIRANGTSASFEILPGFEPSRSVQYSEWLERTRTEAASTLTRNLISHLERARQSADWAAVERIAHRSLALDPYNEIAVLAQAEAVAMRGSKHEAIALLDRFLAELGDDSYDLRVPATILRRRVVERLSDHPAMPSEDPPFIGREREMTALMRRLRDAKAGIGSATLITGHPGIGKSRLCAEIARFAQLQGLHVQRIACRRTDLERPLSVFVDVVPQLTELPGALGCSSHTLASLKRLTGYEREAAEMTRPIEPEELFRSVQLALFDLLDSVAEERCLLLLVEDIHWLDPQSAKLLSAIADWAAGKRLVLLMNGREGGLNLPDFSSDGLLTLRLEPLDAIACEAMLASIMNRVSGESDTGFATWCLTVSEGNPFFLQELARQWMETGARYEAPPSVAKVLDARLSRLSDSALQVLQTASVLGEFATLERVERVLQLRAHHLLGAVEELSKSAMLRPSPNGSHVQPRHDLIASAALGRIAPLTHAFIHRRSAEVLESETEMDKMPATLLWACANHRHHSGDRQRALALSVSCAEHLLDVGLPHNARSAFDRSLVYCLSDEERLRVLPRIAVALQMEGKWDDCKEILSNCIKLSAKVTPELGTHNDFELQLLEVRLLSTLEYKRLLDDIMPCVECRSASAAHRVRAAILALKIATDIGPAEVIDAIYGQVSPLLADSEVPEALRLEVRVIYETLRLHDALAVDSLRQLCDLARANGGRAALFNALIIAASSCRISGHLVEGLRFIADAVKHAKTQNIGTWVTYASLAAVRLNIAAGRLDSALQVLRECEGAAALSGDMRSRTEVHYLDSRIALETGDLDKAAAAFASIGPISATYSASRRGYACALGVLIRVGQKADESVVTDLVRELERAYLQIEGIGEKDFESYALYVGLSYLGQHEKATRVLRDYARIHRRSHWPLADRIRQVIEEPAIATAFS